MPNRSASLVVLFGGLAALTAMALRSTLNAEAAGMHVEGGEPVLRPTDVPVVVELFTSEGCSSCPSADAVLAVLERTQPVPGVRVIPLEFHVDYWDELGWPDRFASSAYTRRQSEYGALGVRMYTPQAVVDGRSALVGSYTDALKREITDAAARPHASVELDVRRSEKALEAIVRVGTVPGAAVAGDPPVVLVVVTQARATVEVSRGENAGRTLEHTAIVRSVQELGAVGARGGEVRGVLRPPSDASAAALRVVALVQRRGFREILGGAMRLAPH